MVAATVHSTGGVTLRHRDGTVCASSQDRAARQAAALGKREGSGDVGAGGGAVVLAGGPASGALPRRVALENGPRLTSPAVGLKVGPKGWG